MSDCVYCPASMCPLIAKDGSPWSGEYEAECPEHDDLDTNGCPWWSMACGSGAIKQQVLEAEAHDGVTLIVGPNKIKRTKGVIKEYDCDRANECSWQKQAGNDLCPPRLALSKGLDPRVCLF